MWCFLLVVSLYPGVIVQVTTNREIRDRAAGHAINRGRSDIGPLSLIAYARREHNSIHIIGNFKKQ